MKKELLLIPGNMDGLLTFQKGLEGGERRRCNDIIYV